MKHWIWYLVSLAVAAMLWGEPFEGTDVAQLQPVQVVQVTRKAGQILVQTDTGDLGCGQTLEAAFTDLKRTTSGRVFLETADYLLLVDAQGLMPELTDYLRSGCSVCTVLGEADLKQVAAYLKVHPPQVTLGDYKAGQVSFPCLTTQGGRMWLVQSRSE